MRALVLIGLTTTLLGCKNGSFIIGNANIHDWSRGPDAEPYPYGFWGLNGYQTESGLDHVESEFGITTFHTSTRHPNYAVNDLLPLVQDAGLSVRLRMCGPHDYYTDADGDFDLASWKSMLDEWKDSGVEEFIADGTLAYHMMLDDIDTFPGRSPSGDDLDAMARYSKRILPGLPTMVREEADRLPVPSGGYFEDLDASLNQYRAADGGVEDFAIRQMDAAAELDIAMINGLNVADGGDGSSGQPGWTEGRYAMSAQEIIDYGYVMTGVPGTEGLMVWEYDGEELWSDGSIGTSYLELDALKDALQYVGERAAGTVD